MNYELKRTGGIFEPAFSIRNDAGAELYRLAGLTLVGRNFHIVDNNGKELVRAVETGACPLRYQILADEKLAATVPWMVVFMKTNIDLAGRGTLVARKSWWLQRYTFSLDGRVLAETKLPYFWGFTGEASIDDGENQPLLLACMFAVMLISRGAGY